MCCCVPLFRADRQIIKWDYIRGVAIHKFRPARKRRFRVESSCGKCSRAQKAKIVCVPMARMKETRKWTLMHTLTLRSKNNSGRSCCSWRSHKQRSRRSRSRALIALKQKRRKRKSQATRTTADRRRGQRQRAVCADHNAVTCTNDDITAAAANSQSGSCSGKAKSTRTRAHTLIRTRAIARGLGFRLLHDYKRVAELLEETQRED